MKVTQSFNDVGVMLRCTLHNVLFLDASRMTEEPKIYTKNQLALRNGQDRDEIWIAYLGHIYDVSRSRLWRRGNHYEHWAGQDLTAELDKDAPHTANVFDNFPIVGRLA